MIIEGNPYNVTYSHLGQIKRKLALIDIIEAKWIQKLCIFDLWINIENENLLRINNFELFWSFAEEP